MALRRLQKELRELKKESFVHSTDVHDIDHWTVRIIGPPDSPYEHGIFSLDVQFSSDHPFCAPKVLYNTSVYHPNINQHGEVCIDILKRQWSPALTATKIVCSLLSLMCDPNPDDPLVQDVATVYKNNRSLYDRTAKEWTEKYAKHGK